MYISVKYSLRVTFVVNVGDTPIMTNQKYIEIFHHLINPQLYIRISL